MIRNLYKKTSELSTETPLGIIGLFEEATKKFNLKVAMQIKSQEKARLLSYKKLRHKVIRVSSNLIESGIQFYDRVAILSENRPEWAISYFGILASGSVAVPLDTRLKEKELVYVLNNSKTKAIFFSGRHLETVRKITDFCPELKFLICMDHLPERPDIIMLDKLRYRKSSQKSRDSKFSDVAMVVYTSGSTGLPKGVELTYSNLLFQVQTFQKILASSTDDRVLSVLPLNHALELTCGLLGPLYSGACITYLQTSRPEGILSSMKEIKPSIMTVVPLLVKIMHNAIFRELNNRSIHKRILFFTALTFSKIFKKFGMSCGRQLFGGIHRQFGGSLRYMLCGGAPLDKAIARDLDLMGIPILQGYGLTESSPTISVNTLKENRIGSVGKPLPGVDVKILKEHEGDKVGEIITRGPHVMKGYLDDIEKTYEVIKDGWLHTGDLGYLDKEGYLFITGRMKNLIVTGAGKKVQPEELEDLLLGSPYIRESCVVGKIAKEGLRKGYEEVYAVIVPDVEFMKIENSDLTEEKIRKMISTAIIQINKEIADYKKITGFEIWDKELPKTSTRKVKRKEVVEHLH